MNLPFKTKWPDTNRATFFPEKILSGLDLEANEINFVEQVIEREDLHYHVFTNCKPKLHTIRDGGWKKGMKIHFCINNRSKNRYQFAPVRLVESVQNITITYPQDETEKLISNPEVRVDGKILNHYLVGQLAQNDGFPNLEEFFKWFSGDFAGIIIHWTTLKY